MVMTSQTPVEQSRLERANEQAHARRVRLPGFLIDEEVGLGDLLKRAGNAFGIKPCGGCSRRAETLNRWLAFTPKQ
jgi:hypothetical protein